MADDTKITVTVMRKAVLMEDEGLEHAVEVFIGTDILAVRLAAEQWIARQKNKYHPPDDYYIADQTE